MMSIKDFIKNKATEALANAKQYLKSKNPFNLKIQIFKPIPDPLKQKTMPEDDLATPIRCEETVTIGELIKEQRKNQDLDKTG